jgi:HK97 family phage major capsid protein
LYLDGKENRALEVPEFRALQADSDTQGGYTVPKEFTSGLIQAVDDILYIRQLATKFQITGESLGMVSLDTDPDDADWTKEIATGGEDSSMAFGKRELTPHPLAKLIKISQKLMRASGLSIVQLVTERIAYKQALPQEVAFMTGSGAGQPLGLFTASAQGISTGRDVSTGNTNTAITFDGLIEALYSLKSQYMAKATGLFHRTAIKNIRKLKDGESRYLWEPATRAGDPATILGRPFIMSENVPNTFTTGLYVGMWADFSFYHIADALAMEVQRLNELYARTNQVGLITRSETDAMPVIEEAFARVTLT